MKLIPKILTASFLVSIIIQTFLFVSYNLAFNPALAGPIGKPVLQVDIPGLEFSDAQICDKDKDKYCISWMSEYIIAVYSYGAGIAGILTAVVLAYAGILYAAAGGSPDKINQAKGYLTGGLAGLVLIMVSYLILNTINPQLTTFVPLEIKKVEPEPETEEDDRYFDCAWESGIEFNGKVKVDENKCPKEGKGVLKNCYCARKAIIGCEWLDSCGSNQESDKTQENCDSSYNYQRRGATKLCCCSLESDQLICEKAGRSYPNECGPCKDCAELTGIAVKKTGNNAIYATTPPKLKKTLVSALQQAAAKNTLLIITEAWPPTGYHQSTCHRVGACCDVALKGQLNDESSVVALYNTLKEVGLKATLEANDCSKYPSLPADACMPVSYSTGLHFHVTQ